VCHLRRSGESGHEQLKPPFGGFFIVRFTAAINSLLRVAPPPHPGFRFFARAKKRNQKKHAPDDVVLLRFAPSPYRLRNGTSLCRAQRAGFPPSGWWPKVGDARARHTGFLKTPPNQGLRSVAPIPVGASRAPQRDQGFSRASWSSPRVRRSIHGSPVDFRAAERARRGSARPGCMRPAS